MDGVFIMFVSIMIVYLAVDYAAQFRPPDHEAPSDARDVEQRDQGDDAA